MSNFKQVGEFPGPRSAMRSVRNPFDKSTIVSIYPKDIFERKYTIQPGEFRIPKGSYANPTVLTVGPSSWWRTFEDDQPMLEVQVSSYEVANSVIRDYCNGIVACDMEGATPGLFFVPGEVSTTEVLTKYKEALDAANARQNNWYLALVRMADALWARSNGNPLTIADEMRIAARSLNLNDKDWLKDFQMIQQVRCVACGSMKHPDFPVCSTCRAVDPNHPAAKDLKFAS